MKRERIKVYGLCSHTTPNGTSRMGREEVLRKKFDGGTITKDELREYACFMAYSSKAVPATVSVRVFGKLQKVTVEEYNTYYKPLGFQPV